MCGIAGVLGGPRVDMAMLKRMTRALAHRGPDDEGIWIDEAAGIGLGHRRLSIVDLSPAGRQPMPSPSGRYVITFARADLPKVASNNRTTATPEENKAIVGGSVTHFGTLSVNAADQTITFKIETATFPNWDGTEQKRPFTLTGDELQWTVPAASGGGTGTTVWKRAK